MKKVIALVMCVAMIACIAVTAAADTAATITVSSAEGKVGEVVSIDVAISAESDIGSMELSVVVDEEILKPTTTKDKRGDDVYFVSGEAASLAGALVEGSDGIVEETGAIKLATATSKGYWDAGVIWTLYFEIVGDLPEEGAVIDVEVVSVGHFENDDEEYDMTVVDGKVTARIDEPSVTPPSSVVDPKPVESKPVESKPVDEATKTDVPKTGDASAVAVAAGLCAVMAAAFVITKKVND